MERPKKNMCAERNFEEKGNSSCSRGLDTGKLLSQKGHRGRWEALYMKFGGREKKQSQEERFQVVTFQMQSSAKEIADLETRGESGG